MTPEVKDRLKYLRTTYVFAGIPLAIIFWLILVPLGLIRVRGLKRLLDMTRGDLVLPNHESMWELPLMVALYAYQYILHPFLRRVYTAAAIENFFGKWWSWVIESCLIPIYRQGTIDSEVDRKQRNFESMAHASKILKGGGVVIIYGGGGRRMANDEDNLRADNGVELRAFNKGPAKVAIDSGARITPVWIEWTWLYQKGWVSIPRRMHISIGEFMEVQPKERDKALTTRIESALLNLANRSW